MTFTVGKPAAISGFAVAARTDAAAILPCSRPESTLARKNGCDLAVDPSARIGVFEHALSPM